MAISDRSTAPKLFLRTVHFRIFSYSYDSTVVYPYPYVRNIAGGSLRQSKNANQYPDPVRRFE